MADLDPKFETRAELDAWAEMDAWCKKQCDQISVKTTPFIMSGGNLNSPKYRAWLGSHQAFMRMRSFIAGSRRVTLAHSHLIGDT